MNKVDLSIVVPVHNNARSIEELVYRINSTANKLNLSHEVILVDDGSKDQSWKAIQKAKSSYDREVVGVRLEKNVGQHNAIICGLNYSHGALVVTMDADLQHPPEEIEKLILKHRESESDVVYGIYKTRKHGFLRSAGSVVVQKSSKYFADHKGGVGSSFRLFTRSLVDKIKNHSQNFIYIDEIIHWYTGDINLVPVEHHERKVGKSSYSFYKLVKLYIAILVNFTAWPLKIITFIGFASSILSFLIGVRFILKKLFFNVGVPGFTALIVTITFSASLILLSLGIIGQYIYKIYHQQNGKPPYAINRVI
ncbi:MAG: glycosyltransferase family 2 protein [Nonlabens sp.]